MAGRRRQPCTASAHLWVGSCGFVGLVGSGNGGVVVVREVVGWQRRPGRRRREREARQRLRGCCAPWRHVRLVRLPPVAGAIRADEGRVMGSLTCKCISEPVSHRTLVVDAHVLHGQVVQWPHSGSFGDGFEAHDQRSIQRTARTFAELCGRLLHSAISAGLCSFRAAGCCSF